MVLPASHRGARALQYLGTVSRERDISLTGLSPSLVGRSSRLQLSRALLTLWLTPESAPQPRRCCQPRFRLFPVRSPLLGESRLISVPGGTEMFHFPPFAALLRELTGHYPSRVTPFGHPRVSACLAARRGFSQLAAPFIACLRQGILRMLLVAYPHLSSCRTATCIYPLLSTRTCQRAFSSFFLLRLCVARKVMGKEEIKF